MADLKKIKLGWCRNTKPRLLLLLLCRKLRKRQTPQYKSLETLNSDKEKVEAERDALKAKTDALGSRSFVGSEEGPKMDGDAIKAAVAKRVKILDARS